MTKKGKNIANRITIRLIMWMLVIAACISLFFYNFTLKTITAMYAENFHNKMLGCKKSTSFFPVWKFLIWVPRLSY